MAPAPRAGARRPRRPAAAGGSKGTIEKSDAVSAGAGMRSQSPTPPTAPLLRWRPCVSPPWNESHGAVFHRSDRIKVGGGVANNSAYRPNGN